MTRISVLVERKMMQWKENEEVTRVLWIACCRLEPHDDLDGDVQVHGREVGKWIQMLVSWEQIASRTQALKRSGGGKQSAA